MFHNEEVLTKTHTIITGTGRAGTTFLVQYFTALGLETGYTRKNIFQQIDLVSKAGLELDIQLDNAPYIIKRPSYSSSLQEIFRNYNIDFVILPIRKMHDVVESRKRVSNRALQIGKSPFTASGGLDPKSAEIAYECRYAKMFYDAMHSCVLHNKRVFLLEFPNFVKDHDCLYNSLKEYLDYHQKTKEESEEAFRFTSKPQWIHDFT